jgi:hypothetical protein
VDHKTLGASNTHGARATPDGERICRAILGQAVARAVEVLSGFLERVCGVTPFFLCGPSIDEGKEPTRTWLNDVAGLNFVLLCILFLNLLTLTFPLLARLIIPLIIIVAEFVKQIFCVLFQHIPDMLADIIAHEDEPVTAIIDPPYSGEISVTPSQSTYQYGARIQVVMTPAPAEGVVVTKSTYHY